MVAPRHWRQRLPRSLPSSLLMPSLMALLFAATLGISFRYRMGRRLSSSVMLDLQLTQPRPQPQPLKPSCPPNSFAADATTPKPQPLVYPLWWAAPFQSDSGYGSEARSYILGLAQGLVRPQDLWLTEAGGDRAHYIRHDPQTSRVLAELNYAAQRQSASECELQRPAIVVCHSFPTAWLRNGETPPLPTQGSPCPTSEMQGRFAYTVGRTMFEMDRLPEHLVDHVRALDEVWVPTEFNRQTFAASGVNISKIHVLPESINLTEFDPARFPPKTMRREHVPGKQLAIGSKRAAKKEGRPFVFLSIFKWEARKGWEILLKAFLEEFTGDEDVELHIVTHPFMEWVSNWGDKLRAGILDKCGLGSDPNWSQLPRVYVSSNSISAKQFPKLYKGADALVIPTRGEGWGRPQMEAMAMELPVISTNWSGLTSFLNEDTGYPIRVDGLVEAQPDGPNFFGHFKGLKWAEPSGQHLRQLMRCVVTHREEARAKGVAARRHLQNHFNPNYVAQRLHRLVLDVQLRAQAHERARARAQPQPLP